MRNGAVALICLSVIVLMAGCGGSWSTGEDDTINNSPVAQITEPSEGSTYTQGDVIQFSGTGHDSEDGAMTGSALAWTSNVDGQFGTGESCASSVLSPGPHQVTLTATDTAGAMGVDTIAVRITIEILIPGIPDTGQTMSYTDTFGEDSDYTNHPHHYTKLDAAGTDLPEEAASWAMVRDDVTGLIWEAKTDNGSIHDKDNRYTWQDAQDVFIAQLNSVNFGGYTDWRLPTFREISMLVDRDRSYPAIDTTYFPNTDYWPPYWTSTTESMAEDWAYAIPFASGGNDVYTPKSASVYVRAVRGQPAVINLVDNGNGTVTDINTGLMWQQAEQSGMSWDAALVYCEDLTFAGQSDWRLPNFNEILSLVGNDRPAIDTTVFPTIPSDWFWSSTRDSISETYALVMHSDSVVSACIEMSDTSAYVRCVRGGNSGLYSASEP